MKVGPFSLHCSWGVRTPRFTLLNQEDTVLHSCCTAPTGNMMLKRCWGTFVYKPKTSDELQCWLPYIPPISNHCVLKNKTSPKQTNKTTHTNQTNHKPLCSHTWSQLENLSTLNQAYETTSLDDFSASPVCLIHHLSKLSWLYQLLLHAL